METLFLIIGLVIYLVILSVLLVRVRHIRRGEVYDVKSGLSVVIEPKIDKLAYGVIVLAKETVRYGYILVVLVVEKIIQLIKYLVIKMEKRFARIVNQVRGKGEITKPGAASLFLKEIKKHRDKVKAELSQKYDN